MGQRDWRRGRVEKALSRRRGVCALERGQEKAGPGLVNRYRRSNLGNRPESSRGFGQSTESGSLWVTVQWPRKCNLMQRMI